MTHKSPAFLASLLVLSMLFGFGCRVSPRVVRAPNTNQSGTVQDSNEEKDSFKALAYVELNGGKLSVSRGDQTVHAEDHLELRSGDRLKVDSGTISIIYPDAGVSELEEGSEILLIANGDDAPEGSLVASVEVLAGRMWSRFERVFGPTETFSVSANGVVATVRGTAFGVSRTGDDIDVQVADHLVEVTQEDQATAIPAFLAQGQALTFTKGIKQTVRQLSSQERNRPGYLFALKKRALNTLHRPLNPIRLNIQPKASTDYLRLRQNFLKRHALLKEALKNVIQVNTTATFTITPGFTSPARQSTTTDLAPVR